MTRKEYELIATLIATAPMKRTTREVLARHFAKALTTTSPRFDEQRFVKAATKEES